ncbi:growth hormone secretagogue receptor type 1 isoform X1 [Brachionus plicatilis]|uniref:Growth hormone secretagogue receptor type 1 isoform X1 n=1 Tax=Brachionus plicatilis TaxID=10195 RepID=A0A3M7STW6_BRAPC|nr:growth hormone secretagogue receptor type 1 isoform X1 [Brachionus plicatilis]
MLNNNSNELNLSNQETQMPLDIILFGSILYSLIFFIGVFGNILVISVILIDKDLRNFTNYLLANLSVADLLLLFTNVPSGIHDLFAKERWYFGKIWCFLVSFIEHTTGFASILSIFFITCDRYYVICRPLVVKSLMNQSRTLKLIAIIWLMSFLTNLPFIALTSYSLAKFSNKQLEYKCATRADQTWALYFIVTDSFIFYILIGSVLIFMYYKIFKSLKVSTKFLRLSSFSKSSKQKIQQDRLLKLTISEDEDKKVSFNPNINQSLMNKHVKQRQQLIIMLMIVLVTFYVCIFPLKIWNLLNLFAYRIDGFYQKIGFKLYWILNVTTRLFYYTNCAINPIVYKIEID